MTQLAGNLEDLGLGEILQIISFSRKSGVLRLKSFAREGAIFLRNGNVVKAASTEIKEGVGDFLVEAGVISRDVLEKARHVQKDIGYRESLGNILIKDFNVSQRHVASVATKLIEKVVISLFRWVDGTFIFELVEEYMESPEGLRSDTLHYTLEDGLNPQFLAMEGSRLLDESKRESVPPAPPKADGAEEAPQGVEESFEIGPETFGAEVSLAEEVRIEAASFPPVSAGAEDSGLYFQDIIRDMEKEGAFPGIKSAGPPEPRVAESRGLRLLRDMLSELSRPLSLNEIVLLILRFSSEMVNRTVVFAVKKGNIVGLGQVGVEIKGGIPDKTIKKMSIPLAEPSILREAIETKRLVIKENLNSVLWNDYIIQQLGGVRPWEAFAMPVVVQGKVGMILYGDNAPERKRLGDISTLEIFLAQTSICLERLVLKKAMAMSRKAGS